MGGVIISFETIRVSMTFAIEYPPVTREEPFFTVRSAYAPQKAYAQAKILREDPDVVALKGGVRSVYALDIDGETVVFKQYPRSFSEDRLSRLLMPFEGSVGGLAHRLRPSDPEVYARRVVATERRVLENWSCEGIAAPLLRGSDENSLLHTFIPGHSYASLIENGLYGREHRNALLERIEEIRDVAFTRGDPYLLHNDLYLPNFIYDENVGAVPIDPGLPFREDLGVRELDAHVNLVMLYSLVNEEARRAWAYNGVATQTYQALASDFVSILDDTTRDRMRERNIPIGRLELALLDAGRFLGVDGDVRAFRRLFHPRVCRAAEQVLVR